MNTGGMDRGSIGSKPAGGLAKPPTDETYYNFQGTMKKKN
jgi:hypothetical protein